MKDMKDLTPNELNAILIQDLIKERRAERRWKIIRSLIWIVLFAYVIFSFAYYVNKSDKTMGLGSKKYVSLIRIDGMIAPGRNFSAEEMIPALKEAFSDKNSQGVIIDINSPGGTPVQSAIIHDAILDFKKKYNKKVIVVGEDMLTSGAYYVAVAADKIYVNPNTLTGSVGVVMKGFGFVEMIKKLGIERRVYTAGSNKDRLDPFLPQNQEDIKKIQSVMDEVQQNFANAVFEGRKGKLTLSKTELLSADFWSGSSALKLGLIDNLGNLMQASEIEFNTTNYKNFGNSSDFLKFFRDEVGTSLDNFFLN